MRWTKITSLADESSFLDDQVAEILSSDHPSLPPFDQTLGHVDVHWSDEGDRRAFIQTRGGTSDDHILARQVVSAQLASCGFREATKDWGMEKTADWNQIQQKAKRLMQSGAVQILRNGYNNIVAQVQGDHGTYQSEIFRQDPNSRAITGSDCECLLPGGRVILADGSSKPIEECFPGERVLTASGGIGVVKRLIVNEYDGEAISLKPTGSTEEVWVTANHPVFDRLDNIVEASKLRLNDVVYYPQPQISNEFVVVFQALSEPQRKHYTGSVYNLEVEDEHTYVMYPGIACHNCGWGEFQNQPRTRQWKKFQDRPCWLPGSLVSMADGTRVPIEDVKPGDRVLSAHGPQTVSHHHTNVYDGEMQTIQWWGSAFGTTVTHDHKMITHPEAARIWQETEDNGDRARKTAKALQSDGWTKTLAYEVRSDDWIKLAYQTETQTLDLDIAEITGLPSVNGRCRAINHCYSLPDRIVSEKEVTALLTLAGYYLAEGSIEAEGKVVGWTLHADEMEYVDAIESALTTLGAGPLKRYSNENRIALRSSNVALVRTLKYLCGQGSRTKQLSSELMLLPAYHQRFFLERYAEGDGTGNDWSSTFVINTASEMLARQLVAVGARLYRAIPTLSWFKNSGGPTRRDADDLMIARVKFNQRFNNGVIRLEDGYYAARVREITSTPYSGTVYNLTVPPHHTVAVDGVCSYQCAHILAAFWQAQSMPLDEDNHPDNPQNPQQPGGFGQGSGFGAPADQGFDPAQRSFDPSGAMGQSASPGGVGPQGAAGEPVGPSPADVLPQYPMAQMPQPQPQNLVSIPGGTPPSPTNPVQFPAGPGGTFSSVNPWGGWQITADDVDDDPDEEHVLPTAPSSPAQPQSLQNGDMVQLRYPDTGTLVGRSEEHGAGDPFDLTPGMVGEVLGTHPTTGMHNILWAGKPFEQNKEFEPWGAVGWHFPSYLLPRKDVRPPGPAIRRRR